MTTAHRTAPPLPGRLSAVRCPLAPLPHNAVGGDAGEREKAAGRAKAKQRGVQHTDSRTSMKNIGRVALLLLHLTVLYMASQSQSPRFMSELSSTDFSLPVKVLHGGEDCEIVMLYTTWLDASSSHLPFRLT